MKSPHQGPKTKCLNIQFGSNSITYNATPKQKLADVLENIVSSTKSLKSTPTNSFCLKYRGGDEKMNVDLIVENLKSCDLEIYQVKRGKVDYYFHLQWVLVSNSSRMREQDTVKWSFFSHNYISLPTQQKRTSRI